MSPSVNDTQVRPTGIAMPPVLIWKKTEDPAGRGVGRLNDVLATLVWGVSWGHRGCRRAGGSNGLRDSRESQPKDHADVAL